MMNRTFRRTSIQSSWIFTSILFSYSMALAPFAWAIPVPPSEIEVRRTHTIRVRLDERLPRVQVRGFDLKIHEGILASDQTPGWNLRARPQRMSEWSFFCKGSRITATRKDAPKDSPMEPIVLKSPAMVRTPAGFLSIGGKPYREELRIYSRGSGCELVNAVDLEKYLDGLVNSEFSSQWNEEAIAAQVVAARTYALFQMMQARKKPSNVYDLDATVKDQVYDGSLREDYRASKAVSRTRGYVLVTQQGGRVSPIKAFYHSTCGGTTELPGAVWGKDFPGFKQRVKCGFCYGSPRYEWDTEYSADELAELLLRGATRDGAPKGWPSNSAELLKTGKLIGISPIQSLTSGRVEQVFAYFRPAGKGGVQVKLPIAGPLFRTWVGLLRIRSTQFRVLPKLGKAPAGLRFQFFGRGNGHGVGMCQWGAKVMGEKGFTLSSILAHYYPGAVTKRLW